MPLEQNPDKKVPTPSEVFGTKKVPSPNEVFGDLKKKEPTASSSLSGQSASLSPQTKTPDFSLAPLPTKTWLQQGNEIASNSLLKNISKQATAKSQGTYQPEQEGSWGNIAQNLIDRTFETALSLGKGAINLYRALSPMDAIGIKLHKDLYDENGDLTEHAKSVKADWKNDPSGALLLGLNGIKNVFEEDLKYNKLPDSYAGRSAEQIIAMVPDITATALLPEARLAEGAGLIAKTGKILLNNFTKYLGTKEALESINKAKESGKTNEQALVEGLKGGLEGTKQGAELALIGFGGGKATGAIMKNLEKAGFTGTKGMVTKELVNTAIDLAGYSLVQPTFDAALKGELPTKDQMLSGIAPTVVFRLKDIVKNAKTNSELNQAIKEIQEVKQGAAFANFLQATPESIMHAHYSNESAEQLSAKSLELLKQSKETTNLDKKHDLIIQAITLTKSANVKHVSDIILNNPEIIDEISKTDLPKDVKDQFVQKANEIRPMLEKSKANVVLPEENVAPEVVDQNRPTKPAVIMPEENISTETTTITPEGEVVKGQAVEISNENINKYNEAKSFKKKKQIVKEQLGELSEEDNSIVDNLNKEDLDKIANSNFDLETFKNIKNAIQEPSASSVLQYPQEGVGKTGGERRGVEQGVEGETITTKGEKAQPQGVEKKEGSENVTGVTHAETNAVAAELGLPEYEKNPETFEEWDKEADRRLQENKNTIPQLLKKLGNNEQPDKIEQRIMAKYLAALKNRIDNDPTNDKHILEYKRAKELSDKIGGAEVAKSLAARKPLEKVADNIGDFMLDEMQSLKVDELTDKQKEDVINQFNQIKKAKEEADAKLLIVQEENNKLKAEQEIKKAQQEIVKAKQKEKSQKTKEQFAKEREALKDSIKDKWKKAGNANKDILMSSVFGGKQVFDKSNQLIAIAPDVAKLLRSYAAEGVTNLNEMVKKIKGDISEFIPEITEKDINALIAGEYNKKRGTRNELAERIKDIKDEAKLIEELDRLKNGKEPLLEKDKIKRNQKITELRKEISDLKKTSGFYDETNLKAIASKYKKEAAELEKRIKEGDYDKPEKKVSLLNDPEIKKKFPEQLKQAEEAKAKLEELKNERQVKLLKQEYANRTDAQKAKDFVLEVANLPRTIMSSMDFSAPLRQGLLATVSHPILAAKAAKTMIQHAASQKEFDKWFTELRESDSYKIMEKSGLYVADPHDLRLTAKEDAFMNNLAEKIPVVGKMIKGSERAYVSYLNKMRVDLFRQYGEVLENQGKTFQNSPELYKGIASFVNNATGRGGIGALENAAPILNAAFFSPRLIASRLNILGVSDLVTGGEGFYGKLPKEVRVMAYKDILKVIGAGMSVLALAKLNGAKVEDDPRSSDFGKIVSGNNHYDIWGGFQQYIRLVAQIATGQIKQPNTGKIKKLGNEKSPFGRTRMDVLLSFGRGKLAPIPSVVVDYLSGKTAIGEKVTLERELQSHLLPLIYSDVKEAYNDEGVKAIFTVGVPASLGVGVQTYDPKKKKQRE